LFRADSSSSIIPSTQLSLLLPLLDGAAPEPEVWEDRILYCQHKAVCNRPSVRRILLLPPKTFAAVTNEKREVKIKNSDGERYLADKKESPHNSGR